MVIQGGQRDLCQAVEHHRAGFPLVSRWPQAPLDQWPRMLGSCGDGVEVSGNKKAFLMVHF